MPKSLPLYIGLRYIRSKRRNQFISFVSGFSLLGMAFGVMSLIVVMSVMNGFEREMKQRILGVIPHGFVTWDSAATDWQQTREAWLAEPDILAAAPFITGFGLATKNNTVDGVNLQGVDPAHQASVSAIADNMLLGSLDDLTEGDFGIVIGALLARHLGVVPGDRITLTLPDIVITPAGVYPRMKRFTVRGVFRVNAPVDQDFAMIHIRDAARLLRHVSGPEGLQIKVADIYNARDILNTAKARLGDGYVIKDWSQTQGSLFQAMQMEKRIVATLLSIIIAVAAFNIVSSLVLMVADKRSDIAVLRTLGLSARQVMGVFMVQGFGVGVLGTLLGVLTGCLLAFNVGALVSWAEGLLGRQVFDPSVYFISHLPSVLEWRDVIMTTAVALLLSFFATLYPAWRAAQIQPAEALRYE